MSRTLAGIAIIGGVLSLGTPSLAQDDAAQAIEKGLALRREQRDEEALAEFRRAYALHATPRVRAQIALAEQALGRWRDAEADLAAALADRDDPWIASKRAALEATREELGHHVATLRVASSVAGAQVEIDGAPPLALPQSLRVDGGEHVLRVAAPGYAPVERQRTLEGGSVVDEDVALVPLRAPATPIRPPAPDAREIRPPRGGPTQGTWGWITLATAAAPLSFGVIENVIRNQQASFYDDNTRCPPGQKDALCASQRANAQTATALSIVGYAGAGALAAVGAVLLLTAPGDRVGVTAWAAPGAATAGIVGRF